METTFICNSMKHQYKPDDFAEIHKALSPTINLINMYGFLLMFIL